MYIKKGNGRRMYIYSTTNERSFNEHMNELAGTTNVAYSGVWPMHISNGKQYMDNHGQEVARVYADQLLHGRVPHGSLLALHDDHLTDKQRDALSYLKQSNRDNFESALHMCELYRALPRVANNMFKRVDHMPHFHKVQASNAEQSHAEPNLAPVQEHAAADVADVHMAESSSSATPTRRISLNAPGSSQRNLSLNPKAKKPRRK